VRDCKRINFFYEPFVYGNSVHCHILWCVWHCDFIDNKCDFKPNRRI
jgi:hypothetical protein